MAKLALRIDGVDILKTPMIQNEIGVYYWNGAVYEKPPLPKFNTHNPSKGFKKYGPKPTQSKPEGGHWSTNLNGVNIRKQQPIDFGALVLGVSKLYATDRDWKLTGIYGTGSAAYATWTSGAVQNKKSRWCLYTVHVKRELLPKVGTVVKKGKPLCTVFYDHFHLFLLNFGKNTSLRNALGVD